MTTPLRFHHPQVALVLNLVQQLQARERLAPPALHSSQAQALQMLFNHAWQHSPFWRARLNQTGLACATHPLAVLAQLPVLERLYLQRHFDDARARAPGWADEHMAVSVTSGSTGQPVRVEKLVQTYTPLFSALGWLDNLWHQRNPGKKLAMLGVGLKEEVKAGWDGLSVSLGHVGLCVKRNLDDRTLHSHLQWLVQVQPAYLKCSPMVAADLAALALGQGLTLKIEHIMCQSERVSPRHRALCQQAFGATLVDRYTCEESGWIALQCPEHGKLHVVNPGVLLEIVDDDLKPCPPGAVGRVLLTSLHSYAMPLIRYDLGDLAEWGACACGRTWPVLGKLWGRTRNRLQLRSGQRLAMPFLGDDLGKIASIREFRVLQYQGGEVQIQLSTFNPLTETERQQVADIFVTNGLSDIDLHITEVPAIDWPVGRKREEFQRVNIEIGAGNGP